MQSPSKKQTTIQEQQDSAECQNLFGILNPVKEDKKTTVPSQGDKMLVSYFKFNLIRLFETYKITDGEKSPAYQNIITENINGQKTDLNKFKRVIASSLDLNENLLFGEDYFFFKDDKMIQSSKEIDDWTVLNKKTRSLLEAGSSPEKILISVFPFYSGNIKTREDYDKLKESFLRCCLFIKLIKKQSVKKIRNSLTNLGIDSIFIPEIGIPVFPEEDDDSEIMTSKLKNLVASIDPSSFKLEDITKNEDFNSFISAIDDVNLAGESTDEFLSYMSPDKATRSVYKDMINKVVSKYKNSSEEECDLMPTERLFSSVKDAVCKIRGTPAEEKIKEAGEAMINNSITNEDFSSMDLFQVLKKKMTVKK